MKARQASGYRTQFTHDEDIKTGKKAAGTHEKLRPQLTNNNGEHAGKNIRECMDSEDHPNAIPIAVLFDVTGSMGGIPMVLQQKLPELHGLLQKKGYVEDPQILFGSIGDAHSDRAPLQIGQFESDNRMDDDLARIWLEGGGGGQASESYELAAYFMARHTHIDSLKKRGKKGYLFFIGDERAYAKLNPDQVKRVIGGVSSEFSENLTTRQVFEELQKKYEVFYLFAVQSPTYRKEEIVDAPETPRDIGWKELLGERALVLDDAAAVCETIALTLGVMEGMTSLEDGMEDLKEIGADSTAVEAAGKALATVGAGSSAVAVASGAVPGLDDGDSEAERL